MSETLALHSAKHEQTDSQALCGYQQSARSVWLSPNILMAEIHACPVAGLELNHDRPDKKLPYRGAWLWIGPGNDPFDGAAEP